MNLKTQRSEHIGYKLNNLKINKVHCRALIIFGTLLSLIIFNNVYAQENYLVALVNNLPITKIDVVDRAKLISYSINKDIKFKNLHQFYDESLKTLIKDNIKRHAGLQYDKNILNSVSNKAYTMTLFDYQNSEMKLNKFINDLSISKASILSRYQTDLVWSTLLQNKFKQQFIDIDKEIKKIIELNLLEKNKDKYNLAEITIQKNDLELFNKIMAAIKQGANFSNIAKQLSNSPSSKFGGNIGWKKYEDLPKDITKNKPIINEGDLFNFKTKDTINIIKILVKRKKGKVSSIEDKVLLAKIKFEINFGNKAKIYSKIKNRFLFLLEKSKTCDVLKNISVDMKEKIKLNVIESRIADLNKGLQSNLKNLKLFNYIGPIYKGNNGFLFVFCDKKKKIIKDLNPNLIKRNMVNKRFIIMDAKYLKKITQNAVIKTINQIN